MVREWYYRPTGQAQAIQEVIQMILSSERWAGGQTPWDEVDVTIAERRPLDALQALRRVEKMLTRPPSPQSSDPLHKKKVLQGGSCHFGIMTCTRNLH